MTDQSAVATNVSDLDQLHSYPFEIDWAKIHPNGWPANLVFGVPNISGCWIEACAVVREMSK
jgi:hypothetical protein